MFGYIRPFKPDLRIREFDTYKALYCGLCGQLGKSFGPASRLTLSYDFAFLAMLHYGVSGRKPVFDRGRCFVNPLKRISVCQSDPVLEFGADMASIMLYYKVLDNMRDGGPLRKIAWTAAKPFAANARGKAAARRPLCDQAVGEAMAGQAALEAALCDCVDEAAEPTAKAMETIFAELSAEEKERRILARIGYLLGRYVYLCDALDDIVDDLRRGSYNPLVLRDGLSRNPGEDALRAVCERARDALYLTAGEAGKAYGLLDPVLFGPILDNVFYLGLRAGIDEILLRRMPKMARRQETSGACEGCLHAGEDVNSSKEKPS